MAETAELEIKKKNEAQIKKKINKNLTMVTHNYNLISSHPICSGFGQKKIILKIKMKLEINQNFNQQFLHVGIK